MWRGSFLHRFGIGNKTTVFSGFAVAHIVIVNMFFVPTICLAALCCVYTCMCVAGEERPLACSHHVRAALLWGWCLPNTPWQTLSGKKSVEGKHHQFLVRNIFFSQQRSFFSYVIPQPICPFIHPTILLFPKYLPCLFVYWFELVL